VNLRYRGVFCDFEQQGRTQHSRRPSEEDVPCPKGVFEGVLLVHGHVQVDRKPSKSEVTGACLENGVKPFQGALLQPKSTLIKRLTDRTSPLYQRYISVENVSPCSLDPLTSHVHHLHIGRVQ
jgi:hypothetical protein